MKYIDLDEYEWIQIRLDLLNLIDEKRLAVVYHGQMYQKRMTKSFNKKVKHRIYQAGDLVIKCIILPQGGCNTVGELTFGFCVLSQMCG